MKTRQISNYLIAALLVLLVLLAFVASTFYTFAVGKPGPPLPATATFNPTSSATPAPPPAGMYADQIHITDGLTLLGIIIVIIIIFGAVWGRRTLFRR